MAVIPILPAKSASITVNHHTIYGSNRQELLGLKKEIFTESRYYVDLNTDTPRILDGGAHVGLAALYFKTLWPKAKMTCIEPLPENYTYLTYNLWNNHLDDVVCLNQALASQKGEQSFYFDASPDRWYSTAGFTKGAWDHTQLSTAIKVSTTTLNQLLTQPTDIVKLDIEGAEMDVLTVAQPVLPLVRHLILEYHPNPKHSLNNLLTFLKKHHFIATPESYLNSHTLTVIHATNSRKKL